MNLYNDFTVVYSILCGYCTSVHVSIAHIVHTYIRILVDHIITFLNNQQYNIDDD